MQRFSAGILFVCSGLTAALLAACGGAAPTAPRAAETPSATPPSTPASASTAPSGMEPESLASDIRDFALQDLVVEVGTTVTWTNRDTTPHTATSGTPGNPSGAWDSGNLAQGGSFSITFDQPGRFPYYCRVHPSMTGTVTVTPKVSSREEQAEPTATGAPAAATPTAAATVTPAPMAPPPPSAAGTPTPGATPSPAPPAVGPTAATPAPTSTASPTLEPTLSPPVPSPTPVPTERPALSAVVSEIRGFTLESLTIPVGTTVTWINRDSASHTATSGTEAAPTGVWDSGILRQGGTFSFTFTQAGTFPYYCDIHPSMTGTITVAAGTGE